MNINLKVLNEAIKQLPDINKYPHKYYHTKVVHREVMLNTEYFANNPEYSKGYDEINLVFEKIKYAIASDNHWWEWELVT